jgi:precorrin-2 dehydrogenase/sirohydrochlorin ferrochelatase
MKLYPLMLKLTGKTCVVIGGGQIAERKIRGLLNTGATIHVIAPVITQTIRNWEELDRITVNLREFQQDDVLCAHLIIAATDKRTVNNAVFHAVNTDQWVNIVDQPERSNFYVPAVLERGDLQIAISTHGKYPSLARKLKQRFENQVGPEFGPYIDFLDQVRNRVRSLQLHPVHQLKLLQDVLDDRFMDWMKQGEFNKCHEEINRLIGYYAEHK